MQRGIEESSADLLSAGHISDVDHQVVVRRPLLKLAVPGRHGGQGDNDEERSVQLVDVGEVVEEPDGLDGLAKPHLVSQDHRVTSGEGEGWRAMQHHVSFSSLPSLPSSLAP